VTKKITQLELATVAMFWQSLGYRRVSHHNAAGPDHVYTHCALNWHKNTATEAGFPYQSVVDVWRTLACQHPIFKTVVQEKFSDYEIAKLTLP
jgi:hypothetical protein